MEESEEVLRAHFNELNFFLQSWAEEQNSILNRISEVCGSVSDSSRAVRTKEAPMPPHGGLTDIPSTLPNVCVDLGTRRSDTDKVRCQPSTLGDRSMRPGQTGESKAGESVTSTQNMQNQLLQLEAQTAAARVRGLGRVCFPMQEDGATSKRRVSFTKGPKQSCVTSPHSFNDEGIHWLERVVTSTPFELGNLAVIFGNAVFLALDAGLRIRRDEKLTESAWSNNIEWGFCCYYILELTLRTWAHGCKKIFAREYISWHLLDFVLVGSSIFERVGTLTPTLRGQSFASLRSVRIIRCVQTFRLIHFMRLFRELRLITSIIAGSLKPLIWSSILMLTISFMFGTCILQATSHHVIDNPSLPKDDARRSELLQFWGSIDVAMLSLFWSVTGGDDWRVISTPLHDLGNFYYLIFLFFICFYTFVMVNTINSVFVAASLATAEEDDMQVMINELDRKDHYVQAFTQLFKKIDKDDSEYVSMSEFNSFICEPEMVSFAAKVGLEIMDMKQVFLVLSSGGTHKVDMNRFIVGCLKMKGPAKSLDLMELAYRHSKGVDDVKEFAKCCTGELTKCREAIGMNHHEFAKIKAQLSKLQAESRYQWSRQLQSSDQFAMNWQFSPNSQMSPNSRSIPAPSSPSSLLSAQCPLSRALQSENSLYVVENETSLSVAESEIGLSVYASSLKL